MKNFTLSVATVLAMSTFAVAGGDIEPVVAPVEEIAPAPDDSGFYIGGAYSMISEENEFLVDGGWVYYEKSDFEQDAFMLQAGYTFNKYIAVEGRYWSGFGDSEESYREGDNWDGDYFSESGDFSSDSDAWGIYLKPMYPVTDEFTVYGLVGYADVTIDYDVETWGEKWSDDGFSWGLGASYDFTDNLSVFADYVVLLNDDTEPQAEFGFFSFTNQVDTWNFGLTYKF